MKTKCQLSAEIAAQIAEFEANGGTIEQVEYHADAERAARVGRWLYLGHPVHDQTELRKYGEDLVDTIHDDDLRLYEQERDYEMEEAIRDSYDYFPTDEQEDWY